MPPAKLQLETRRGQVILPVKVAPAASRNRIVGRHGGAIKVSVSAPPERGKANNAVIRLLAKALRLRASQLRVAAGHHSPNKTIAVQGLTAEQVISRLEPFLGPPA